MDFALLLGGVVCGPLGNFDRLMQPHTGLKGKGEKWKNKVELLSVFFPSLSGFVQHEGFELHS